MALRQALFPGLQFFKSQCQLRTSTVGQSLWILNSNYTNYEQRRSKYMPSDPIDPDNIGVPNPKYPLKRVARVLRNDWENLKKGRLKTPEDEIWPAYCDIVIIGGGIIGNSIAYHLKQSAGKHIDIVIVEKDITYARASTTLSVGGIRQQFSNPENVQMSMYGYEFLREIKKHLTVPNLDPPEINFWPNGYLMLASEAGAETMMENHKTQRELGAKVELITAAKLKERFGWLNVDGVALGNFGYCNEGWFDPHAFLMAFKLKGLTLGVKYVNGEVIGFKTRGLRTRSHIMVGDNENQEIVQSIFEKLDKITVKLEDMNEVRDIQTSTIIIAAGANSGEIGKLAGLGRGTGFLAYPIPVEPRKRYAYFVDCPKGPGLDCPLVIDPSGTYFRKDGFGTQYLCGKSPSFEEEPDPSNLDVDYSYFDNTIWPNIANRVPSFEELKLKSAYAGYYDYNYFDQNGIVGQHPYYHNIYLATGFSGHGLQHAPAVGRAVAELLIEGAYKTINLKNFGFFRFIDEVPLLETGIV